MKKSIRESQRAKRRSLTPERKLILSAKITSRLKNLALYQNATTILYYVSTPEEVFTHDLIKESFQSKRVIVPKTLKNPPGIKLCEITSWDVLGPGEFGVLESHGICDVDPGTVDLAIIPGVAFDKTCNRLGHGFGYYDRLLKEMTCPKIGLGFDFQIMESVPKEEHDIHLDMVITENIIINRNSQK